LKTRRARRATSESRPATSGFAFGGVGKGARGVDRAASSIFHFAIVFFGRSPIFRPSSFRLHPSAFTPTSGPLCPTKVGRKFFASGNSQTASLCLKRCYVDVRRFLRDKLSKNVYRGFGQHVRKAHSGKGLRLPDCPARGRDLGLEDAGTRERGNTEKGMDCAFYSVLRTLHCLLPTIHLPSPEH